LTTPTPDSKYDGPLGPEEESTNTALKTSPLDAVYVNDCPKYFAGISSRIIGDPFNTITVEAGKELPETTVSKVTDDPPA
jgi:hypothetical protein